MWVTPSFIRSTSVTSTYRRLVSKRSKLFYIVTSSKHVLLFLFSLFIIWSLEHQVVALFLLFWYGQTMFPPPFFLFSQISPSFSCSCIYLTFVLLYNSVCFLLHFCWFLRLALYVRIYYSIFYYLTIHAFLIINSDIFS